MPNAIARSLQSQRTGLVALAVEDIGNPVYVEMMRAIEAVVAASGRQLLVHATGGRIANETALLRRLAHRYVDGMIVSPIRVTDDHLDRAGGQPGAGGGGRPARARTRRSTTCAPTRAPAWRWPSTTWSPPAGGGSASSTARSTPSRAPPATPASGPPSPRHGIQLDERLVEVGDFQYAGRPGRHRAAARPDRPGRAGLRQRPDRRRRAARPAGRRAPGAARTSPLVGMDDTELARMMFPQLSSVSLGSAERGRRAAELLLQRIADPTLPPRREQVPPSLAVRASSAHVRPRRRSRLRAGLIAVARRPRSPVQRGVTA